MDSEYSSSNVGAGMWGKLGVLVIGVLVGSWYFRDEKLDTLKGKRVLVTGASTGIGEQVAYHLASLGCHVTVTSRRLEALQKVTKRCQQLSPYNYTHHAVAADMEDLSSTKNVIEKAISLMGGLDILILNHIKMQPIAPYTGSSDNITLFEQVTDVNFKSYVHLTSYALPQLIANKGYIVAVNSLLGKVTNPFLATYSASKHALHGFFGSLRNQFLVLGQDVSVTSCTLGLIGTENAVQQLTQAGQKRVLETVTPASPIETARAILVAAARRESEMYYPYWIVRTNVFLYHLYPEVMDAFMRYVVSLE